MEKSTVVCTRMAARADSLMGDKLAAVRMGVTHALVIERIEEEYSLDSRVFTLNITHEGAEHTIKIAVHDLVDRSVKYLIDNILAEITQ